MSKRPKWQDAVQLCPIMACRGTLRWVSGRDNFQCCRCQQYWHPDQVRKAQVNREFES